MRVTMRHIEANGIGYNSGYTTLEGFFAPSNLLGSGWIPFMDLRGHVFNTGKMAANAGLGLRYQTHSSIFGINAYYDYRNAQHQHYNQISAGLEWMGHMWDARINGYLPVGDKTSRWIGSPKFSKFQGHHAVISRKYEFVMKGANAEVGVHIGHSRLLPFYMAAGPYYLEGKGRGAWGGELRARLGLSEYIRLEGNTSYDSTFRWIGQGQLSVIIPFGKRKPVKTITDDSCRHQTALACRALQPVDRMEIIPVSRKRVKSLAINPTTGSPYVFWFVNNQGHSLGTFESPLPFLIDAIHSSSEGDIIYIFPGDGTTTGLHAFDIPFQIKQNQQWLGAANTHTLYTTAGDVILPALSSHYPRLTANDQHSVISLASGVIIDGLHITARNGLHSPDIWCMGFLNPRKLIENITIRNNFLEMTNGNSKGIVITSILEKIVISDNVLINGNDILNRHAPLTGIQLNPIYRQDKPPPSITIKNNTISGMEIGIDISARSSLLSIINNQIEFPQSRSSNPFGIGIQIMSSQLLQATIENNTTSGNGITGLRMVSTNINSIAKAHVNFNNFSVTTDHPIDKAVFGAEIEARTHSTMCLQFQNNTMNQNSHLRATTGSLYLEPYIGNTQSAQISTSGGGVVTYVPQNYCNH